MNTQSFSLTAALVFLFAGSLHLVRVLMNWQLVIGNFVVPPALSVIASLLVLFLAYQGFVFSKKK